MDSNVKAERLLVFIVYRAIFRDGLARIRKPGKIKAIVQEHWPSCEISVGGYGMSRVVDVLGDLLRDRVFESEVQARDEFPELFRNFVPDGRHHITPGNGVRTIETQLPSDHADETGKWTTVQHDGSSKSGMFLDHLVHIRKPSLTPILFLEDDETEQLSRPCPLPKSIQHRILTNTQSLLETSCFDFAARWLPAVLHENGWDCAVACELQRWIRVLKRHVAQLPNHAFCTTNTRSLEDIARSIPHLRHTAVHRLSLTTNELLQLLMSAVELTVILHDEVRAEKLRKLYDEVKTQIDWIDQSKKRIRDTVSPQLRRIQGMRAGLTNRERHLLSETKQKEKHADDVAIEKLNDLIAKLFLGESLAYQGDNIKMASGLSTG